MTPPPKYPGIPYLDGSHGESRDDLVLDASERAAVLRAEVVVEEKLDGMNVMLWLEAGVPQVGTRGGAATSDRSGERGRLRAWAAAHVDTLADGLDDRFALYGEWLRRRHVVPYDRLPAQLVGFDVLDRRAGEFIGLDQRDAFLAKLGIATPPACFRGILGSTAALDSLLGPSAFADTRAEGLVIRTTAGSLPRVTKYVDPAWRGIGSAPWTGVNLVSSTATAARA